MMTLFVWITKFILYILKMMFGTLLAMILLLALVAVAGAASRISPYLGYLAGIIELGLLVMWIREDPTSK
jgi:hypothetical protein